MKHYSVIIRPYIVEPFSCNDDYLEISSLDYLPSSVVSDNHLENIRLDIKEDNLNAAVDNIRIFIRRYTTERSNSSLPLIVSYRVEFTYFYNNSSRVRAYDFWVSKSARSSFYLQNRSYLTREQVEYIINFKDQPYIAYLN